MFCGLVILADRNSPPKLSTKVRVCVSNWDRQHKKHKLGKQQICQWVYQRNHYNCRTHTIQHYNTITLYVWKLTAVHAPGLYIHMCILLAHLHVFFSAGRRYFLALPAAGHAKNPPVHYDPRLSPGRALPYSVLQVAKSAHDCSLSRDRVSPRRTA